jgi:hypothetical protein
MKNIREDLIRQKFWQVWKRTQLDAEYAQMYREMDELERQFESVMETLPDEIQDVIRDYVMKCESMSDRMLECACEEIVFPQDIWDDSPLPPGGWPACRIIDLDPEELAKMRGMPYNQSIQ